MNTTRRFGFWRALREAFTAAFQWRVLVLWLVSLGLIALIATVPVWQTFDRVLSHTIESSRLAHGLDAIALGDVINAFVDSDRSNFAFVVSIALSVLLSPWLTGVMLAAIRQGRAGRLGSLAGEGMREYGRQLRLMIWSLLPLGIALGLGMWWMNMAGTHADTAILASDAKRASRIALIASVVVFLVMHATIELTRARIAVRDDTRSVIRAWWRSLKLFFRRPLAVLGLYVLVCVLGFALVLLLARLRVGVAGIGMGQFVLALLCGQLVVAAMTWMRLARLRALAAVVDDDAARTVA